MDKLENLKKIKELFDKGVLSEKEYSEMKNEILSNTYNDDNSLSPRSIEINEFSKLKSGKLTIIFSGQWFLFDVKTQLFVNNELNSTHSTKKGFKVEIPITRDKISIKVLLMSMKSTIYELEELDTSKDYSLVLTYDSTSGKYSNKFKIIENG